MKSSLLRASLLPLALSLLAGCGGGELVGIHVDLSEDGSGTVTVRSLAPTETPPAAAAGAAGVTWEVHAGLVSSRGRFEALAALEVAGDEVRFAPQLEGDRPGLRVTLRRGEGAKWLGRLTPDRATRQRLAKAHDPAGRTKEIGDVVRLEVRVPGEVISSGVLPTGRGVEADRDGRKAILLLPARAVTDDGEDFVWDITWRK
jgi:hypothetical protein